MLFHLCFIKDKQTGAVDAFTMRNDITYSALVQHTHTKEHKLCKVIHPWDFVGFLCLILLLFMFSSIISYSLGLKNQDCSYFLFCFWIINHFLTSSFLACLSLVLTSFWTRQPCILVSCSSFKQKNLEKNFFWIK